MPYEAPPWFAFLVSFWESADVQMLTHEQKGVLMDVIVAAWRYAGIPEDEGSLTRLLRIPGRRFAGSWRAVRHFFEKFSTTSRPDFISISWLEESREKAHLAREKSAKGGKALASKRAQASPRHVPKDDSGSAIEPKQCPARSNSNSLSSVSGSSDHSTPVEDLQSSLLASVPSSNAAARVAREVPNPLGKEPNAARRRIVDSHLAEAQQVLEELNAARKRLAASTRGIRPTYTTLAGIAGALDRGQTVEECLAVVESGEREVRRNPSAENFKFFDAVSPWRPDNFARRLGAADMPSAISPSGQKSRRYEDLEEHARRFGGREDS